MKCIDRLEKDHQLILRAVEILEEMAARIRANRSVDHADIEKIVRFLKVFEDEHHQGKEESALFPALRKLSGIEYDKLQAMHFEHDQERSLAQGLEDALKTKNRLNLLHFADRLGALLRRHIEKEESALFGLIETVLSEDQDNAVVAEFTKFDESFNGGKGRHALTDLRALEARYLTGQSTSPIMSPFCQRKTTGVSWF